MTKKILNVIETAYRATIEEQDDTIVWISHALRGAGAELSVLLRGNAVNYAVKGQDARGLAFGEWRQTQPPDLCGDLVALHKKNVPIYAVQEDLSERGLGTEHLAPEVKLVPRSGVAALFDAHERVWYW